MRLGRATWMSIAASALTIFSVASASAAALPPDLAKAVAAYDRAQVEGDRSMLEKLLASDYHLVNGGAELESRSEFIAESTTPGFKMDPFVVQQPLATVWADGAVLAGLVHITGRDSGKPFNAAFRFADIWAKRGGRWQVVFTEVTRLPPAK